VIALIVAAASVTVASLMGTVVVFAVIRLLGAVNLFINKFDNPFE